MGITYTISKNPAFKSYLENVAQDVRKNSMKYKDAETDEIPNSSIKVHDLNKLIVTQPILPNDALTNQSDNSHLEQKYQQKTQNELIDS